MIMHYDMATGDIIGSKDRDTTVDDRAPDTRPALRLQPVDEAVALERRTSGPPADVVSTLVEALLRKWD